MKEKKRTVIIAAIMSMYSLIVFTFLELCGDKVLDAFLINFLATNEFLKKLKDIIIIITSGIFTGSIVTFALAISDYFIKRNDALEKMYLESNKIQLELKKIKYFLPDEPQDLLENLFHELDNNERIQKSLKVKKYNKTIKTLISHEKEQKFRKYIYEKLEDVEQDVLDRLIDDKIRNYNRMIEETMKSFLEIDNIQLIDLGMAYSQFDFIVANRKIRKDIYENLYIRQCDMVNQIKEVNFHFREYFNSPSGGNRAVAINKIFELQKILLTKENSYYYKQYNYDIDCQMEKLFRYFDKNRRIVVLDKKCYILSKI